jgi:hypothetical protein
MTTNATGQIIDANGNTAGTLSTDNNAIIHHFWMVTNGTGAYNVHHLGGAIQSVLSSAKHGCGG